MWAREETVYLDRCYVVLNNARSIYSIYTLTSSLLNRSQRGSHRLRIFVVSGDHVVMIGLQKCVAPGYRVRDIVFGISCWGYGTSEDMAFTISKDGEVSFCLKMCVLGIEL
jgi:hypothetical protein